MIFYPDKTAISSARRLFTALLLVFLIHNSEEAFTICRYPAVNPFINLQILNCKQFLVSVSVISTAAIILYIVAIRSTATHSKYLFISTGLSAALLLNAFIPHLLVALLTLHYTPGLITAVLLILPFSILVLHRNSPQYKKRNKQTRDAILFIIPAYLFFALVTRLSLLLI